MGLFSVCSCKVNASGFSRSPGRATLLLGSFSQLPGGFGRVILPGSNAVGELSSHGICPRKGMLSLQNTWPSYMLALCKLPSGLIVNAPYVLGWHL